MESSPPPNPSTTPFWHILFPPTHPDNNDSNGADDLTTFIELPSTPTNPPKPCSTGPTLLDDLWSAKLSLQATTLQQTQEQQRLLLETVKAEVGKLIQTVEMQGKVVGGLRELVERMEKVQKGRELEARRKEKKQADVLGKLEERLEVLSTSVSASVAEKRKPDENEAEKLEGVMKMSAQMMESLKAFIAPQAMPWGCDNCVHRHKKILGHEKVQEMEMTPNNPTSKVLPPPLMEIPTLQPEPLIDQTTALSPLCKSNPPSEHSNPNPVKPTNDDTPESPAPQPPSRTIAKSPPPKRTLLDESQDEFEDESQLIIIEQTPVEAAGKMRVLYEHQSGQGREVERRPQKRRLLESQYEDDDLDF